MIIIIIIIIIINNNNNKCIYNADPSPHPCYQLKLAINLLSAN